MSNQEWVTRIDSLADNGHATLQVRVSDERLAEEQLLPILICDEGCTVIEYGRRKYELEEIFMGLVEGDNHG